MKLIDLTGQRFGRLVVIKRTGFSKSCSKPMWLCICDCGNTAMIRGNNLRSKITASCGCLQRELAKSRHTTHGMTNTKIYEVWKHMHTRCRDKTDKSYKDYGARGITVCERWLKFKNFYADMGECPKGLMLERIDNNKGYFPDNCKWATLKEQANNKRANITIEYQGQHLTLSQWADKLHIKYPALWDRIRHANWPTERALTEKVNVKEL